MKTQKTAVFYAILAASLYALNAPASKLLLTQIPSTMMAGLLYLGAGVGMFVMEKLRKSKYYSNTSFPIRADSYTALRILIMFTP